MVPFTITTTAGAAPAFSVSAATSTLLLVNPQLTHNPGWTAFAHSLWVSTISLIALKGIKPTAYLQVLMN